MIVNIHVLLKHNAVIKQISLLNWLVNNVLKIVMMLNISKRVMLMLIRIHVLNLVVNKVKELMPNHMFGMLMVITSVQSKWNAHQQVIQI